MTVEQNIRTVVQRLRAAYREQEHMKVIRRQWFKTVPPSYSDRTPAERESTTTIIEMEQRADAQVTRLQADLLQAVKEWSEA